MKALVNRHWKIILLTGLFLYLLIISMQSVTLTDEGFYLSSYQTFFPDPNSNGYFFMYYLSMLIGGIWEQIVGGGGILSFRILNSITILASVLLACSSLRYLTEKKKPLIMASIFTVVFLSFNSTSFSYNTLSLLLICLLSHNIVHYYQTNSKTYLMLAGFISGISVYARIPNILFLLIPVPVLLAKHAGKTKYLSLMCGFLGGIVGVSLIMNALDHVLLFVQVVKDIFILSSSYDSSHGITKMCIVYLCNIRDVSAVTLSCFALYYIMKRKHPIATVLCIIVMVYWILVVIGMLTRPGLYGVIYGILFFGTILYWLIHSSPQDEPSRLMALHTYLGIALAVIYPLGSDNGIYNVANISTFWLCFIVCVMWLGLEIHTSSYNMAKVTVLMLTTIVLERVIANPSFSGVSRVECVSRPHESSLANIYMRQEAAIELDGLLKVIKSITQKGDYVLCYPNIPMINYLSETRPYLYNCWPKLYTSELLKFYLNKAVAEKESLPVVVRQKQSLEDDKYQILIDFTHRYNYNTIANNTSYEILIPNLTR